MLVAIVGIVWVWGVNLGKINIMEYRKISELAIECQSLQQTINEFYRFLGSHRDLDKQIVDAIDDAIGRLKDDIERLEKRLRRLVK